MAENRYRSIRGSRYESILSGNYMKGVDIQKLRYATWKSCGVSPFIIIFTKKRFITLSLEYLKTLIKKRFIATYPMGHVTTFEIFR